MEWMIKLPQLLLSLSFLVAVHEFGHLLAAKYFKMRVEQFSIGFPPKLWSFRRGETEYAISAIPLGGYVKISGMIDESLDTETMKQEPQPWEFRSKPAWQRLIVMLGGIIVNVIVGIIIFIALTFVYGDEFIPKDAVNNNGGYSVGAIGAKIGLKTGDKIIKINGRDFKYMDEVYKASNLLESDASYTVDRQGQIITINIPHNLIESLNSEGGPTEFVYPRLSPVIAEVMKDSIAGKIGLKKGDRFITFQGKPVSYFDEVSYATKNFTGKEISFSVKRGDQVLSFKQPFKKGRAIGFYRRDLPDEFKESLVKINYGFGESIPLGAHRAFEMLFTQVKAFGQMITGKLSVQKSLSGPIGIMNQFPSAWDWERFWSLTGVLSLVLAFMNLLPIPALDGGHVMFLSYEIISRRKPSDKFLENAQKAGMVFLLVLMVFIFANDIVKQFLK